jgi:hypothetical protein
MNSNHKTEDKNSKYVALMAWPELQVAPSATMGRPHSHCFHFPQIAMVVSWRISSPPQQTSN